MADEDNYDAESNITHFLNAESIVESCRYHPPISNNHIIFTNIPRLGDVQVVSCMLNITTHYKETCPSRVAVRWNASTKSNNNWLNRKFKMHSFKLFIRTVLPGFVVLYQSTPSNYAANVAWSAFASSDSAASAFHSLLSAIKLPATLLPRSAV